MAQKIQFGEMNEDTIKQQFERLARAADQNSAPALASFARFQSQRAARLESAFKTLKKGLGADHPDTLSIKRGAEIASLAKAQFATQSARIAKRPRPGAHEWVIYGQVLGSQGQPAAGLRVRAFDRDHKLDDLLGDTQTDPNGDFSITFHERDFMEVGEKLPELYVLVSDAAGKTLYTSRDDVRFRAGRMEYFLIQLGKTPPGTQTPPRKKTRGPASAG